MNKLKQENEKNYNWYIVTTISGKEELIIKDLWNKIKSYGLDNQVKDIKVIKEKIVKEQIYTKDKAPNKMVNTDRVTWKTINENGEVKYKKTTTDEKNKFGGYIFIYMELSDKLWYIIRNTNLITGLVGSSGKNTKPQPISNFEIQKMMNEDSETKNLYNDEIDNNKKVVNSVPEQPKKQFIEAPCKVNDIVKIDGQECRVISINNAKGKVLVEINLFDQQITMEVDFDKIVVIE